MEPICSELCAFHTKYGHCNVAKTDNKSLHIWVAVQRQRKKGVGASLSRDRIERLEKIGFVWDFPNDAVWDRKYEELCAFQTKYGHCNVTKIDDKSLHNWVVGQRQRKKGVRRSLSRDRIERLEKIGFVWDVSGCDLGSSV